MSDIRRRTVRPDRPDTLDDRGGRDEIGAMNQDGGEPAPIRQRVRRRGDAVFRALATGSGLAIVISIILIGVFLLIQAIPSMAANQANFLTSPLFLTTDPDNLMFGIRDLLIVTVLSSTLALVIAMPLALGIALFLTHYAPPVLRRSFAYVVDLLAAVPSIVFGLWGIQVLGPKLEPVARWLNGTFSWFFLFDDGNVSIAGGGTIFTAGIVLAVMILPIITAV